MGHGGGWEGNYTQSTEWLLRIWCIVTIRGTNTRKYTSRRLGLQLFTINKCDKESESPKKLTTINDWDHDFCRDENVTDSRKRTDSRRVEGGGFQIICKKNTTRLGAIIQTYTLVPPTFESTLLCIMEYEYDAVRALL